MLAAAHAVVILTLLALGCRLTSSEAQVVSDPTTPTLAEARAEQVRAPRTLDEFVEPFLERPNGLRSLSDDELIELSTYLPEYPASPFGSDLVRYLYEEGFEDVALLEPFVTVDEHRHEEKHQVALAAQGRVLLLEPPLIDGVLPPGSYLAEIGGLFFEVIGPNGEIWRFTIRADTKY